MLNNYNESIVKVSCKRRCDAPASQWRRLGDEAQRALPGNATHDMERARPSNIRRHIASTSRKQQHHVRALQWRKLGDEAQRKAPPDVPLACWTKLSDEAQRTWRTEELPNAGASCWSKLGAAAQQTAPISKTLPLFSMQSRVDSLESSDTDGLGESMHMDEKEVWDARVHLTCASNDKLSPLDVEDEKIATVSLSPSTRFDVDKVSRSTAGCHQVAMGNRETVAVAAVVIADMEGMEQVKQVEQVERVEQVKARGHVVTPMEMMVGGVLESVPVRQASAATTSSRPPLPPRSRPSTITSTTAETPHSPPRISSTFAAPNMSPSFAISQVVAPSLSQREDHLTIVACMFEQCAGNLAALNTKVRSLAQAQGAASEGWEIASPPHLLTVPSSKCYPRASLPYLLRIVHPIRTSVHARSTLSLNVNQ